MMISDDGQRLAFDKRELAVLTGMMAKDDRPNLAALWFHGGRAQAWATDGHRAVIVDRDDKPPRGDAKARPVAIPAVTALRQVQVQIGFTRFDSPSVDIDDSLTLPVTPAPLSAELEWLPAVELLGEGIFLGFHEDAIDRWMNQEAVKLRGKKLRQGFDVWHKRRGLPDTVRFPGLPYIMLHTLSHLLINAVALECGYSASAIGERVYAGRSGYGILLYTGTPGSEGTLGGLVEVGKRIEDHLAAALGNGQLCSNDPLCAQHEPHDAHEERFLHGSGCIALCGPCLGSGRGHRGRGRCPCSASPSARTPAVRSGPRAAARRDPSGRAKCGGRGWREALRLRNGSGE